MLFHSFQGLGELIAIADEGLSSANGVATTAEVHCTDAPPQIKSMKRGRSKEEIETLLHEVKAKLQKRNVDIIKEVEAQCREVYCNKIPPADDPSFQELLKNSYGIQEGRASLSREKRIVVQPVPVFEHVHVEFAAWGRVPLMVSSPLIYLASDEHLC